jgi:hypothetical protein
MAGVEPFPAYRPDLTDLGTGVVADHLGVRFRAATVTGRSRISSILRSRCRPIAAGFSSPGAAMGRLRYSPGRRRGSIC